MLSGDMASYHTPEGARMSREEIRALADGLIEEVAEHLKTHPVPTLGEPSNVETRRKHPMIKMMLEAIGPPPPSLSEIEIQIPVPNDDWTSRAIITRPSPSTRAPLGPLVVLYYGGGFIMGQAESCLRYARGFAQLFNAVVVCPSYRLAPEHKFPVGVNDAWHVLQWLSKNAASLGADTEKGFIVGGISAGANFAAVLARRSVEERIEPPLTGQWLVYPLLAHHESEKGDAEDLLPHAKKYRDIWGMSWEQNNEGLILDGKSAAVLFAFYEPDFNSPLFNPLANRSSFDLGKMPKAFVQVAGMDLARDDGIVYAYALEDAGVDVKLLAYPGVPHGFSEFFPSLQASKNAMVDIAKGFAWLMGTEVEEEAAKEAMLG